MQMQNEEQKEKLPASAEENKVLREVYYHVEHLYSLQQYEDAAPLVRALAFAKVPPAMIYLGDMYKYGLGGVPQNLEKAGELYHEAKPLLLREVEEKVKESEFVLGWCYELGDGGFECDRVKALEMYKQAAAQNHSNAICWWAYSIPESEEKWQLLLRSVSGPTPSGRALRSLVTRRLSENDNQGAMTFMKLGASKGDKWCVNKLAEMAEVKVQQNESKDDLFDAETYFLNDTDANAKELVELPENTFDSDEFRLAENLYVGRSYTKAFPIIQRLADDEKNPNCVMQIYLGDYYKYGFLPEQAPVNEAKATEYYNKATQEVERLAKLGNPNCQFLFGWMLYNGDNVERNVQMSSEFLRDAASQLNSNACSLLAELYRSGEANNGVVDAVKSFNLLFEGCHVPNPSFVTMRNLGIQFALGQGTSVDRQMALLWLGKAAATGHDGYAQAEMQRISQIEEKEWKDNPSPFEADEGYVQAENLYVSRLYPQAKPLLEKLYEKKNPFATIFLADFYNYGFCNTPRDEQKTKAMYDEALPKVLELADKGDRTAQWLLGWIYYNGDGGFAKDMNKFSEWNKKSIAQRKPTSLYHMSEAFQKGIGVPRDTTKAISLILQAASLGVTAATCDTGRGYASGTGDFPKCNIAAMHWLKEAVDAGHFVMVPLYEQAKKNVHFRIKSNHECSISRHKTPDVIEAVSSEIACAVCWQYERDHVVIPCMHASLCGKCAKSILGSKDTRQCPMCRKPAKQIKKFFK